MPFRYAFRIASLVIVAGLAVSLLAAAKSVPPARTVWEGVFSSAQVERGRKVYQKECARCHGETLGGGEDSPPVVGEDFLGVWFGRSVGELVKYTKEEMPTDGPANYSLKDCTDVTAFMLHANDFPAGPRELAPDFKAQNEILITPKK